MSSFSNECNALLVISRWRPPTAQQIISYNSDSAVQLRPENIIIDEVKVDLTRGNSNPMDNVSFFYFANDTEKFTMTPNQTSSMFPMNCRVGCPWPQDLPLNPAYISLCCWQWHGVCSYLAANEQSCAV